MLIITFFKRAPLITTSNFDSIHEVTLGDCLRRKLSK